MTREKIDQSKAEVMLLAQASREQRLQLNDHLPTDIIGNNAKIVDLEEKVANLYQKLSSLSINNLRVSLLENYSFLIRG